jgi:hypothetical protein
MQERALTVNQASRRLADETGHTPTVAELAARLELDEESVLDGLKAYEAFDTISLDAPASPEDDGEPRARMETVGGTDPGFQLAEERLTVEAVVRRLPLKERRGCTCATSRIARSPTSRPGSVSHRCRYPGSSTARSTGCSARSSSQPRERWENRSYGPDHAGSPSRMRLLVITSEPIAAPQLREALGRTADLTAVEVMLVAPALHESPLKFWLSDAEDAIARAERVRRESVANLEAEGVPAHGDTGEGDPTDAIEDSLRTFDADRIVVFTHPQEDRRYREDVDLAEIERRLGRPVEHALVGAG